ncbi:MAG: DNA-directed RNA polymerase subunit H [Candidatus Woesearchaeota archaeon]|nr:DNA-directed RNA polymerase subunit H [Candidatus Woesearchaeota archaeon]
MEENISFLVPKHRKLSPQEITLLLEKHQLVGVVKLPKIKVKDPAISSMDVVIGDVIEITRESFAGVSKYFRVVIE